MIGGLVSFFPCTPLRCTQWANMSNLGSLLFSFGIAEVVGHKLIRLLCLFDVLR